MLEVPPTMVGAPSSSIPWEKLAFEALHLAGVLATRADDRTAGQAAGQPPKSAVDRATEDIIERDTEFVGRASAILPITVTIPVKTITVSSPLHLEILRIMSQEGLARSWRIAQRVLEAGLAENENSVRNALRRLTAMDLIDDYRERGKPVGWTPTRGGSRRLVLLTGIGQEWCQTAFGSISIMSEIFPALSRHQSIEHAIGVLEARDCLGLAGYSVEDNPQAILAIATRRWDVRTEPDLLVKMEGELWPVEVQREVSQRVTLKWDKSLLLANRLALVLFTNEHLAKQCAVLEDLSRKVPSRTSPVRLASLEEMQNGRWQWTIVDHA